MSEIKILSERFFRNERHHKYSLVCENIQNAILQYTHLSSQNMLNLTSSNTECQSSKGTMSRRVTISADCGATGKSESLLGSDDVHDSLPLIRHTKILESEVLHIGLQLHDLRPGRSLFDKTLNVDQSGSIFCGNIVIDGSQGTVRTSDYAIGHAKSLEGLRGGHLVHEMAVDVEEGGHAVIVHYVIVPNFVI